MKHPLRTAHREALERRKRTPHITCVAQVVWLCGAFEHLNEETS
jgi:hypothetical protein